MLNHRFAIIWIGCLLCLGFTARAQEPSKSGSSSADSVSVEASVLADRIIDEARRWLGTPYRHGGNGPKVFDCTGFTKFIFKEFGFELGRTVPAQAANGREITGNLSDLQKGDILIFASRPNKRRMGHAGIFIGLDSTGRNFNFIHAARTGVIISDLKETYYKDRFLGARRILPDFVPDVRTDSAAVASLVDMLAHTVAVPDTLSLSPADRRVILFADGTWAVVDSLGGLSVAGANERLVLAEGGSWHAVTPSVVRIPVLRESTAEPPKTKSSASSGSTTAPPPPADGSAVYHTIVSGDTLYGLARKYGTTVKNLCNLNGITEKSTLRVGKKIRVR